MYSISVLQCILKYSVLNLSPGLFTPLLLFPWSPFTIPIYIYIYPLSCTRPSSSSSPSTLLSDHHPSPIRSNLGHYTTVRYPYHRNRAKEKGLCDCLHRYMYMKSTVVFHLRFAMCIVPCNITSCHKRPSDNKSTDYRLQQPPDHLARVIAHKS